MKKTASLKRIISLIVVVCFLTTNAMAMPVQNAFLGERGTGNAFGAKDILSLSLPASLGTVIETYRVERGTGNGERKSANVSRSPLAVSRNDRTVIYIQDAHDSLEAQENIAAMVRWLVKDYGVKTVYEEGYEGPVPTDKLFGSIQDPALKEKISYYLMDKLRVGGAEYAHINRAAEPPSRQTGNAERPTERSAFPIPRSPQSDFQLIGADSIALHLENIRAYEQAAQKRGDVTRDIQRIRRELQKLIDKNFSKEMKEWLSLKARYESGQVPLVEYLTRISKPRQTVNGERETQALTVSRSPFPSVKALLSRDERKIKKIDLTQLLNEIKALEEEIVGQGLPSERDQKTYGYYQSILLLEKLNSIRLSAEEYAALKDSLENLKTEDAARFIAKESRRSLVLFKSWENLIADSTHFYELAQKRDDSISKMFDEFLKAGNGERGTQALDVGRLPFPDTRTSVLVFGGFHKEAIKRILKEKGISYVILSPAIGAPSKRHEDYYRMLMSGGKHAFETPAGVSNGPQTTDYRPKIHSRGGAEPLLGSEEGYRKSSDRPASIFLGPNPRAEIRMLEEVGARFRSEARQTFVSEMDLALIDEAKKALETPSTTNNPTLGADVATDIQAAHARFLARNAAEVLPAEVEVHHDHDSAFWQIHAAVHCGKIPSGLPLVLFDYHSDNGATGAMQYSTATVSLANWVKHLWWERIVGDTFWFYPAEGHLLLDSDHHFKDMGSDWKELLLKHLPLLKTGVVLSLDMDYFTRKPVRGQKEFEPGPGEIRQRVMEIFRFLKQNKIPVYLVNGAYSSPTYASANFNEEFHDAIFEAAETLKSTRSEARTENTMGKRSLDKVIKNGRFGLAVVGVSSAVFIALQTFVSKWPLAGATDLRTLLGFTIFMPMGEFIAQLIHLREEGVFKPDLRRDLNWAQIRTSMYLSLGGFAYFWPLTYSWWLQHQLPAWSLGIADVISTNPISLATIIFVHTLVDKLSGQENKTRLSVPLLKEVGREILPKVRNGVIFSILFWGVGLGAVFSMPWTVPTKYVFVAAMEPVSIITIFYFAGQENPDMLMIKPWAKGLLPAVLLFSLIVFPFFATNLPAMMTGALLYVPTVLFGFHRIPKIQGTEPSTGDQPPSQRTEMHPEPQISPEGKQDPARSEVRSDPPSKQDESPKNSPNEEQRPVTAFDLDSVQYNQEMIRRLIVDPDWRAFGFVLLNRLDRKESEAVLKGFPPDLIKTAKDFLDAPVKTARRIPFEDFRKGGDFTARFFESFYVGVGLDFNNSPVRFILTPVGPKQAKLLIKTPDFEREEAVELNQLYMVAKTPNLEEARSIPVDSKYITSGQHFSFTLFKRNEGWWIKLTDHGSTNGTCFKAIVDPNSLLSDEERNEFSLLFQQEISHMLNLAVAQKLMEARKEMKDPDREYREALERAAGLYEQSAEFPELNELRRELLRVYFLPNVIGSSEDRRKIAIAWIDRFLESENYGAWEPVLELAEQNIVRFKNHPMMTKFYEILTNPKIKQAPHDLIRKLCAGFAKIAGSDVGVILEKHMLSSTVSIPMPDLSRINQPLRKRAPKGPARSEARAGLETIIDDVWKAVHQGPAGAKNIITVSFAAGVPTSFDRKRLEAIREKFMEGTTSIRHLLHILSGTRQGRARYGTKAGATFSALQGKLAEAGILPLTFRDLNAIMAAGVALGAWQVANPNTLVPVFWIENKGQKEWAKPTATGSKLGNPGEEKRSELWKPRSEMRGTEPGEQSALRWRGILNGKNFPEASVRKFWRDSLEEMQRDLKKGIMTRSRASGSPPNSTRKK